MFDQREPKEIGQVGIIGGDQAHDLSGDMIGHHPAREMWRSLMGLAGLLCRRNKAAGNRAEKQVSSVGIVGGDAPSHSGNTLKG